MGSVRTQPEVGSRDNAHASHFLYKMSTRWMGWDVCVCVGGGGGGFILRTY